MGFGFENANWVECLLHFLTLQKFTHCKTSGNFFVYKTGFIKSEKCQKFLTSKTFPLFTESKS